ncbi:TonB-dependent receptor [Parablastomonas sp. CN1-191]|uniref:TonB-dependent receptor n=1 Tax=Parablastomonas sp. CN1-191 TaxID=3400908 RepID=UPI003BF7A489
MKAFPLAIADLLVAAAAPALAQSLESQEIMVTGSRIEQDGYQRDMPTVGLRRTADFLVQQVTIRGDSRDPRQRAAEIREMLRKAVQVAAQRGVELAYGDYILTPLTAANIDALALKNDSRPDSQRVDFLVKAPLAKDGGSAAQRRIEDYVEAVPEVGRAQMDESGDASLSIVGPDRYRDEIAAKVMEDSRAMAAKMGSGYAVTVEGLNMPVQWAQASAADVLLFIPYKLVIVPKP